MKQTHEHEPGPSEEMKASAHWTNTHCFEQWFSMPFVKVTLPLIQRKSDGQILFQVSQPFRLQVIVQKTHLAP